MDVHRCRFVPYPPSPINTLSFSHPSSPASKTRPPKSLRLAVGRANGDIEIWNPQNGSWFQESICRGGKERSIECLTWIQDPDDIDKEGNTVTGKLRLVSTGYSEVVTEWNLAEGRPLRHSQSNHGEIWCMAAQPKGQPPVRLGSQDEDEYREAVFQSQIQNIAVGCADGSIVILSTNDEDLHFQRVLARPGKKRSRVLSITFQDRHTIVAGHADSTIRIYDIRGGQTIKSMSLGAGQGTKQETLVWSVKCLKDGTIVSGDSNGVVSFWDGQHYALSQRIQGSEADILDLATSADGRYVFSGGMDRRTSLYRNKSIGGARSRWEKVCHSRLHRNDVKTMATYEGKNFSVMVSGGLDTNLIINPIEQFGKEHPRNLSNLPLLPQLMVSSASRLLVSWWDRELRIWSVHGPTQDPQSPEQEDDSVSTASGRRLLSKVMIQGAESITSACLAEDGQLLVVATNIDIKIFRLTLKDGSMQVRKIKVPEHIGRLGARIVQISPNKHWLLIVTSGNKMKLVRVVENGETKYGHELHSEVTTLSRLQRSSKEPPASSGSLGRYDRYINRSTFSDEGRILVVSDISGYLDTWILQRDVTSRNGNRSPSSEDDSESESESESGLERKPQSILGERWVRNPAARAMPHIQEAPLVLAFRPRGFDKHGLLTNGDSITSPVIKAEDRLLIVTARNNVFEFNVLSGRLTDWSRQNPQVCLPSEFRRIRDPIKGVVWDVTASKERAWLYGVNWVWMFDLSRNFPSPAEHLSSSSSKLASIKQPSNAPVKRKAIEDDEAAVSEGRRPDTGAGSRISELDMNVGIGKRLRKVQGADAKGQEVVINGQRTNIGHLSDDDDQNGVPLVSLHRRTATDTDADAMDIDRSDDDATNDLVAEGVEKPHHWHTFKYRPILGIMAIGARETREGEISPLEVALVERPSMDLDLPPAYQGNQEWNA